MSFSMSFAFDLTAFDLADRHVIASPKLMERAMKRQQGRLKTRALKIVRVKPGKVKYPIKWKSERQRRAFFATNGFGGGIPSTRTDKLINSWDATFEFTESGGAFILENDDPKYRFVEGEDQQPFHVITGWIYAPDVIDDFVPTVLDAYEQTWITVGDPFAGVTP